MHNVDAMNYIRLRITVLYTFGNLEEGILDEGKRVNELFLKFKP